MTTPASGGTAAIEAGTDPRGPGGDMRRDGGERASDFTFGDGEERHGLLYGVV